MRKIGTLNSEELAQRFCDFLQTQSIPAQHDSGGSDSIIWVSRDDDLKKAKELLEEFNQNPDDAKFTGAAYLAKEIRKKEEAARKLAEKNTISVGHKWQRQLGGPAPVTITLIAISILVSLITNFGTKPEFQNKVIKISKFSFVPVNPNQNLSKSQLMKFRFEKGLSEVRESGQIWRLVTPIFLHLHPFHLLFNMIMMYQMSRIIEWGKGSIRLVILVLSSAVISNYAQYLWAGPNFGGMSGVVYALFGFLWIRGRMDPLSGFRLDDSTVMILLGWLVLCMTGLLGPVANAAHLFGLIVGMMAGAYRPLLLTR